MKILLPVSVVILFAVWLRADAARDALWIDEWITAWTVADSLAEVDARAEIGHTGPLYYWLVWGIAQLAGPHPYALRSISLLSSVALLVLIGTLVQRVTRRGLVTLAALALAAVDQHFVFYASEARPYALVQLVGAVQILVYLQLLAVSSSARWPNFDRQLVGWSFLSGLLFLLHYTTALLLVAELLWAILLALILPRLRSPVAMLAIGLTLALAAGVFCSPRILAIWQERTLWYGFVEIDDYCRSFAFSGWAYGVPIALGALAFVLPRRFGWSPRVRPAANGTRTSRRWGVAGGLILTVLVAAVGVTAWDLAPLAHYRYVIGATGLLPVIAGVSLGRLRPELGSGVCVGLLAGAACYWLSVTSDLPHHQVQRPLRYERWDAAVDRVLSQPETDAWPVFVFPNLIEDPLISPALDARQWSYFLAAVPRLLRENPTGRRVEPAPYWMEGGYSNGLPAPPQRHLNPLSIEQRAEMTRRGGAWLIFRAGPAAAGELPRDVAGVLARIVAAFDAFGMPARWRAEEIPQSTVYLLKVELGPAAD